MKAHKLTLKQAMQLIDNEVNFTLNRIYRRSLMRMVYTSSALRAYDRDITKRRKAAMKKRK